MRLTRIPERVRDRIVIDEQTGCWNWIGPSRSAPSTPHRRYGSVWLNGRTVSTHRAVFEWHDIPIADGLQVDHLCRNTLCMNIDHLELVTAKENTRRSAVMGGLMWDGKVVGNAAIKAAMTHCYRGHEYPADPPRSSAGHRICRQCKNETQRARRAAAR